MSGLNLRPHGTGRIFDWFKIFAFRGSVHTDKKFRRLAVQPGSLGPCEESENIEQFLLGDVSAQIFQRPVENFSLSLIVKNWNTKIAL